jgi:death-on-curing protein
MTRFLTKKKVLRIHETQIVKYGGSTGIRDIGLLESALAMPQASFGGTFLHADHYEMAAAYLFHIVSNHPFVDGNKRTGTVAALTFLDLNGYWFNEENESELDADLESLVLSVACGESGKDEVAAFFRKHCDSRPDGAQCL